MALMEQLAGFTDERFLSIYESLSESGFGPLDAQVAKALKFRPQAIRKVPMAKRARQARRILQGPGQNELCYELLGTYLVKQRADLVTGFLDATGVEHEDGMIADVDATPPQGDKVGAAIESLDGSFERDDVTLYLALCVEMWPDSKELAEALAERS